jgi:hypothetical protein
MKPLTPPAHNDPCNEWPLSRAAIDSAMNPEEQQARSRAWTACLSARICFGFGLSSFVQIHTAAFTVKYPAVNSFVSLNPSPLYLRVLGFFGDVNTESHRTHLPNCCSYWALVSDAEGPCLNCSFYLLKSLLVPDILPSHGG